LLPENNIEAHPHNPNLLKWIVNYLLQDNYMITPEQAYEDMGVFNALAQCIYLITMN
jgi:hypothetical protein